MKILLTCGGTGGHITPAIAIADMLRENLSGCECRFVGTEGGMENTMVARAGYQIVPLRVEGLSRKNPFAMLRTAQVLRGAIREAERILADFRPDIVIGTGSYACYPTLAAAAQRGIATAVHESNAAPGLAVRMLATRLDRIWLGFASAARKLPKSAKCLVVGNPTPRGFGKPTAPWQLPTGCRQMVLSFGGSLGAPKLNDAVLSLMAAEKRLSGVYHLHATGKREFERCMSELRARGLANDPHFSLVPFLEEMPAAMQAATLVICRAGAMSITELALAGRAAILVPSPNVTGDHQTKNAAVLSLAGASLMIEESFLGNGALEGAVTSLLSDTAKRARMERAIKDFAHPDANRRIFTDILTLIGARRTKNTR